MVSGALPLPLRGGGGGIILIVEDDPLSRELVVDLLEGAGYTVLQVEDGIGLLERVKRESPDLILLDLQLPGLDGLTLARQLKADPLIQGIPICAITSYAQPMHRDLAFQAGCDAYLSKPLEIKGFLQVVARLLGPL